MTPSGASPPSAVRLDPPVATPVRIRHVDSLRAVAAGLVVWLHYGQFMAPHAAADPALLKFLRWIPERIDVGRMGVLIFFAISGFVICRSFGPPGADAWRRFAIRRLCRLYPAYWVSMAIAWLANLATGRSWSGPALAANATMVPALFGVPYLLGVYWTLGTELLFYGLCLALYLTRRLESRAWLAGIVLVLVWLPRVVKIGGRLAGMHLALPSGPHALVYGLAVMFWGVLFRHAYDATGGFRRQVWTHGGTWLVAGLLWELIDVPDPNFKWCLLGLHPGPLSLQATAGAALLIFTLWVACLRVDNRVLTFLGVVSYSIYLFHLIPMILATGLLLPGYTWFGRLPFWVDFLVCAGLTVGIAAVVYRWVEHPAIALGKRWAPSRRRVTEPLAT